MRKYRAGFTLLEVLISIMLLSLVLMALYKSSEILRASNRQLFTHLERASDSIKGSRTLYMDLLQSDNNITIDSKKEFHHITIERTQHSLYGLPYAKVVWLVYKEDNQLLRVEGNGYQLPLKSEQQVEIDEIVANLKLFKLYKSKKKDKILVISQIAGQEVQSFMIQNLSPPRPPSKPKLVNPSTLGKRKKGDKNEGIFVPPKI
ncbi:MAG TPA: prepilin-type N-terminal cleavage/methylation domain-containing protein [Campylobacterales bacterium]|nr:prepilin-type N-terminal cleavage/methylation domain-containing protein [Campylobacterales bacterium]HIP40937.1 prepilin-type N-terminal cleavage/methylation domain-containing protein [Campylobacterales bacterium]